MNETTDHLAVSGLQREAVHCPRCGEAWDERVVPADGPASPSDSLCPACLLSTTHGDPYPSEGLADAVEQGDAVR